MRKKNLVLPLMKTRSVRGLIKFIQTGLQQNGSNYQVIADRMNTIVEFIKAAKDYGVDADFSKVSEAYQDFLSAINKLVRCSLRRTILVKHFTRNQTINSTTSQCNVG